MYIHDCIAEFTLIAVCFAVRATDRPVLNHTGRFGVVTAVNLQKKVRRSNVKDRKESIAEGFEPLPTAAALMIMI